MKKFVVFAGIIGICLGTFEVRGANAAALNEVVKLKAAGVESETILSFVKGRNLNYDLSADDIVLLKSQGFSSEIISAMLASGRGPAVAAPTTPAPAVGASSTPITVSPQPAPPSSVTLPIGADAAYFSQELSPYGRWLLAEDNQWYWQPSVALGNPDWRPYWDKGHWVYTDNGWYWTSEYSWGWAPFHYGRWHLHPHHGWIWLPDRVWGPGWVVWREGGEYCGWAPLPPGAIFDVATGNFRWHGARVDAGFDFGLDWNHFRFTLVKEMGDTPRIHFRRPEEIQRVFRETRVSNHYSVIAAADHDGHIRVVNHGIEPEHVRERRGRPVETVRIEELHTPAPNRAHERLDRRGKTLEVYRPRF